MRIDVNTGLLVGVKQVLSPFFDARPGGVGPDLIVLQANVDPAMAGPPPRLAMHLIEDQLEPEKTDLTDMHRPVLAMRPVFRKAELFDEEAQRVFSVLDEEDCSRVEVRHLSHLITKRHHAVIVGFDLRQMEGDVPVELLEESDPITNQDREDRVVNFVS